MIKFLNITSMLRTCLALGFLVFCLYSKSPCKMFNYTEPDSSDTLTKDSIEPEDAETVDADTSLKVEFPPEILWNIPTPELLSEEYYDRDSSANARVVQKSMKITTQAKKKATNVISIYKRRIKIYTEEGLEHTEYKHIYNEDVVFDSIIAVCYKPNGEIVTLPETEIYDEIYVESKYTGMKQKAKSFAIPDVPVGSVVDIGIHLTMED